MLEIVNFEDSELLLACARGAVDYLQKYVAEHHEEKDFAVIDRRYWTPLHHAVNSKSFECVQILVSSGLVDVQLKAIFGLSCLDVAIENEVSSDIIELLLENDPNFSLIKSGFDPLGLAIEKNSLRMVEAIVNTLQKMKFSAAAANDFDPLNRISRHLKFRTKDEGENSIKIFEKLIMFLFDEAAGDFMQHVCEVLLRHLDEVNELLFNWCIERYHLTEANQHRDLVQRLLNHPDLGVDRLVIFGLHSDIHYFGCKCDNGLNKYYIHRRIIKNCLLKVDADGCDLINEVTTVLWPKVNMQEFSLVFRNVLFFENRRNQEIFGKMTNVKWLQSMQIGDKLMIESMIFRNLSEVQIILNALMPFSTELSADTYLPRIRDEFLRLKMDSQRRFQNTFRERRHQDEYFNRNYLQMAEQLKQLDDDDIVARYCVSEGKYAARCTLKNLCRIELRKALLRTKRPHEQLVRNIKSLELPKSIERFLLYNYSNYNF